MTKKKLTIFTIGYEGRKPDDFIETLKSNGVTGIIDTRWNARSRKPGFAKTALENNLFSNGLIYYHIRRLGVESELRQSQDIDSILRGYESRLPDKELEILEAFSLFHAYGKLALLCMERDCNYCHRKPLSEFMARQVELRAESRWEAAKVVNL